MIADFIVNRVVPAVMWAVVLIPVVLFVLSLVAIAVGAGQ